MEALETDLKTTLSMLDRAALIVDHSARVLYANVVAERLMSEGTLRLSGNGSLVVGTHVETAALRRLIDEAVAYQARAGRLSVQRPGKRPITGLIAPLSARKSAFSTMCALLIFDDPDQDDTHRKAPDPQGIALLKSQYRLTGSEANLAVCLAAGVPLKDAAAARAITYATARTHLSRIFEKMGVHRQADLCRLMIKSGFDR
jgi:DNA-binding CsgD family transcriptional regulator